MVTASLTSFTAVLLMLGGTSVVAVRQVGTDGEPEKNLVCCCRLQRPDKCQHAPRINQLGADICCKSVVGKCSTLSWYERFYDSFCDTPREDVLEAELNKFREDIARTQRTVASEKLLAAATAESVKQLKHDLNSAHVNQGNQAKLHDELVIMIRGNVATIEVKLAALWKGMTEKAGVDQMQQLTEDIVGLQTELEKIEVAMSTDKEATTDQVAQVDSSLAGIREMLDKISHDMQQMAGTAEVKQVVAQVNFIRMEVAKINVRLT